MCWLSWNMEASTTWKPQALSRPAMGFLYLYLRFQLTANTSIINRYFFAFYECLSTNGYLAYDHTWDLWGSHLVPRRRRSPESLDCRLCSHLLLLHPARCGHRLPASRIQILQLWCHSMSQSCNMGIINGLNKTNDGVLLGINRKRPISVDVGFVVDKLALGLIIPLLVALHRSLIRHVSWKIISN